MYARLHTTLAVCLFSGHCSCSPDYTYSPRCKRRPLQFDKHSVADLDRRFPPTFRTYFGWVWAICQIVPIVQITIACLPLVRVKDDLSDIPLTPAQRKLLGLPPVSTPVNPDIKYSTPPRYSRTPSIAGSAGSRGSYNNSPISGRGSPVVNSPLGGGNGSPYSPLDSPLQQKNLGTSTLGMSLSASRRSSFGSGSPFGISTSSSLLADPASPTPAGGKRTTVGLNSKWLYEKGRRSSGSAWVH